MFKSKYSCLVAKLQSFRSIPLLMIRLVLAYGFYGPAMMKWADIKAIGEWFGSMGIPAPMLNAYMAASTEILGVILLALGLFARVISFPLIVVMIVAIVSVHWGNGFEAGNNGFEIPLYYLIMLITIIVFGAGKYSLDYFILGDKGDKVEE